METCEAVIRFEGKRRLRKDFVFFLRHGAYSLRTSCCSCGETLMCEVRVLPCIALACISRHLEVFSWQTGLSCVIDVELAGKSTQRNLVQTQGTYFIFSHRKSRLKISLKPKLRNRKGMPVNSEHSITCEGVAGLIQQSIQLQSLVTLTTVGSCHE